LPKTLTFGPQYNKKLKKYTQNTEKSLIPDSSLGRRLATPVLKHITFLKGCDAGFPKSSKLSVNFWFEKILVES
jgi:hypothetical protein